MKRRQFLRLLGSVAISAPELALAQSANRTYRVGLINRGAPVTDTSQFGAPLIRGLEKRGYVSAAISSSSGAAQGDPDALLVMTEALTIVNRRRIYDFSDVHRLPVLYEERPHT